mmetsp:Transcript_32213/g.71225  ORF Transcript_32213/g.71225 Transcript_32213/m.71225 type:complete len:80 (+) Transcript_32213:396-635(+)
MLADHAVAKQTQRHRQFLPRAVMRFTLCCSIAYKVCRDSDSLVMLLVLLALLLPTDWQCFTNLGLPSSQEASDTDRRTA